MAKRAKPEEIIAKLREVEVRLCHGETAGHAVRTIGVTEQTYYRWRKEFEEPFAKQTQYEEWRHGR